MSNESGSEHPWAKKLNKQNSSSENTEAEAPKPETAILNTGESGGSVFEDAEFHSVEFEGCASEYFGIWISNLFLSIVTGGIYATWAKVRRIKYFYNNTKIGDFSFNYHATGMQLFKGRMIAVAVLIVYSIVTTFYPWSAIAFSLAFLIAAPWLLNRSLRFTARMTSCKNVRLNWHGTYGRSLWLFVVAPMVMMLSLGTLLPLLTRSYYAYYVEGHSFGVERFKTSTKISEFYMGFLWALVLPAGVAVILSGLIAFGMTQSSSSISYGSDVPLILRVLPYGIMVFVFLNQVMFRAICRNILLRSMTLGNVAAFNSSLNPVRFLWIEISNAFAMLFSLGLLLPWASVRRYRYLAHNTAISLSDQAHEFLDEQTAAVGAFGEEFADLDGLEIGI